MAESNEPLTSLRFTGAEAAVLFVHGFASSGTSSGRFLGALAEEPALTGWDLHALGYSTGMSPDVRGIWEADPSISTLSTFLRSALSLAPLDSYGSLAIIAHSMGGLVVQRALLDDPGLADQVSHLFFFGTPSAGLRIARWGGFLKSQVSDMAEGGPFIEELRSGWDASFGERRPFRFLTVAGDRDAFVPPSSSLAPFPRECQVVVPGNHVELVDVRDRTSMSVRVVTGAVSDSAMPGGPWNAARVALASSEHDVVIRELLPHVAELDEPHLVDLALALDCAGRRQEAIDLLREHARESDTDALGTLAGRLKRAWADSGRAADGAAALELYAGCLEIAEGLDDLGQISYHAINVAFLELALRRDRARARDAAERALAACERSLGGYWELATRAEAMLHLGRGEEALHTYESALATEPTLREQESTYAQAVSLCQLLGRRDLARRVAEVFGEANAAAL